MPVKLKRYTLVVPAKLWAEVSLEGRLQGGSFASEARSALRLWLMVRRGEVEVMKVGRKDGKKMEVL